MIDNCSNHEKRIGMVIISGEKAHSKHYQSFFRMNLTYYGAMTCTPGNPTSEFNSNLLGKSELAIKKKNQVKTPRYSSVCGKYFDWRFGTGKWLVPLNSSQLLGSTKTILVSRDLVLKLLLTGGKEKG